MRETVFVDTGFWIALVDARDHHHGNAAGVFNTAFPVNRIVTSEIVMGETVTYLNCSLKRHDLAVSFLERMADSPVRLLETDSRTRDGACDILRRYSDIPLSYADCVSFALMRVNRIAYFAGYDRHFSALGFQPVAMM